MEPEVVTLPNLRRRHRALTIPSGAVLLACIFLPAVRVCSDPVYPITMPPFWSPYVIGALVGVGAYLSAAKGGAAVRGIAIATIIVMWATIIGWGTVIAFSALDDYAPASVIAVFAIVLCLFAVTERPVSESSLARAGFVGALLSTIWFALFCFDEGAMVGAYLSLASSVGLLFGCGWWWTEIRSPAAAP